MAYSLWRNYTPDDKWHINSMIIMIISIVCMTLYSLSQLESLVAVIRLITVLQKLIAHLIPRAYFVARTLFLSHVLL